MEDSLRELFFSKDPDDIHLACIIARKTNVSPKEVDEIDTLRRAKDSKGYMPLINIMTHYLHKKNAKVMFCSWNYDKWLKEKEDE